MANDRLKLSVFLGVLIAVFAGCSAGASHSERRQLTFNGKIDEASVTRIIDTMDAIPDDEIEIRITSTGGDSVAAMRLGDKIRDRKVTLILDRICHSACAQFLIPSAKEVIVERGASVAFHNSPADLQIPDYAPSKVRKWHAEYRQKERRFFEARGVDYVAWLWILRQMKPVCWFEVSEIPPDKIDRYGTGKLITSVVPSREVLDEIGISSVTGHWPKSWREAISDGRNAGFSSRLTINFFAKIDRKNLTTKMNLPECKTLK